MINRINLILQAKNITAKQFAEEIGIQPSGMSHIMSGRNNPSLEFVNKVIRRYPEIDANWLLLGKGEMYAAGAMESPAVSSPTLFAPPAPSPAPAPAPVVKPEPALETISKEIPMAVEAEKENVPDEEDWKGLYEVTTAERGLEDGNPKEKPAPVGDGGRKLVRILFFYDDHTFEEYHPQE
jgi:DNA-binding XRE family transcriptional regulator